LEQKIVSQRLHRDTPESGHPLSSLEALMS
jgi:hypothetical protein